jgi:PPM family protein phosphatase
VADGVSAGKHSEDASRLTVEMFHEKLSPLISDPAKSVHELSTLLLETAAAANHQVAQRPHDSVTNADATTLVAAVCVGNEGAGVWCGDSRVYQVSGEYLTRLTTDHSWAEGAVSQGIVSPEDAARDPRAHMITRWLGPPEEEDPGIETFSFELRSGEFLLCCSDGLYMYYAEPFSGEAEMAQLLSQNRSNLQAGLDRLVELALQRGGRDNVTAAAIYLPRTGATNGEGELGLTNGEKSSHRRLRLLFGLGLGGKKNT